MQGIMSVVEKDIRALVGDIADNLEDVIYTGTLGVSAHDRWMDVNVSDRLSRRKNEWQTLMVIFLL